MVSIFSWQRRSNGSSQLERKLSALQNDLGRLRRDLRGIAAAGGEFAGEQVTDAVMSAGAGARTLADRAAEQLETWTDGNLSPVRAQVRSQPVASVLLSAGAGALIGAILIAARRS